MSKLNYYKLGDILTIERGGSPRPIQKYITDDEDGLNWIKISDATASDKYIYKTKQKITKDGLYKTRFVNIGDFILSNSMSFGKPYIMKTTGCIHDGWLVFREIEKAGLISDFLYYLLCSPNIFEQFNKLAAGSTVRNLNIKLVSSVQIPLPSISEQKQIVDILDTAFEALEKAKINLEKNLKNTKELFDSKLNEIFSQKGEGWEEKKIAEVCLFKSGKTISKSIEKSEGNILYVKVGDMNLLGNEVEIKSSSRYVDLTDININQIIEDGSIIFPKRGGAIFTNKKRKIIKPTIVDLNTMAMTPKKEITSEYLFNWFKQFDLSDISSGTSIPQINNYSFDNIFMSYPKSVEEQKQITKELQNLENKTKQLEQKYQQKLNNLEELKKSLLQKAFSGELLK